MSEYTENLITEAMINAMQGIVYDDMREGDRHIIRRALAAALESANVATSAPNVVTSPERGKPVAVQPVTPDRERPFSSTEPDHETVCGCGATGNGCCKPVTPDREALAKAIFEYDNSAAPSLTFNPEQHVEYLHMADALLASGVLGQPSSDVQTGSKFEVPQPQPDRTVLAKALHQQISMDKSDEHFEHVGMIWQAHADALLASGVLGQPQEMGERE